MLKVKLTVFDVVFEQYLNHILLFFSFQDIAGGDELAFSELPDQQPGVRHSFVQEHFQAQYK